MRNTVYLLIISALSITLFFLLRYLSGNNILICPIAGFDVLIILVPCLFALFHFLLVSQLNDEKKFIRRFMLVLTLKFLSLLTILFAGLLMNRSNAKCYVLTFLLVYMPFLIFETLALMNILANRKS
jgi:hypothetical protein